MAQFNVNTFAPGVNFTTGTNTSANPYSIGWGKLNNDDKPDLAVPNTGNASISIFRNASNPNQINSNTLATKIDLATLSSPFFCHIGDYDNDGRNDIYVSYTGQSFFSIFRNISVDTNLVFATRQDFSAPNGFFSSMIADVNNDGKLDPTGISFGGNIFVAIRNISIPGILQFDSTTTISSTTNPANTFIADFDNDNLLDFAVANYNSNNIRIFKNTSINNSIRVTAGPVLTTGSLPNGITGGDFNGDGKVDIVVANFNSTSISIFQNTTTSSISFNAKVDFTTPGNQGPNKMCVADFDNDRKLDIAVGNRNSTNNVSVFRNVGIANTTITTATFATRVDYPTGAGACAECLDIDVNGSTDIISTNFNTNTFTILRNNLKASEPTVPPSSFNILDNQIFYTDFRVTKGNGSRRLVMMRKDFAINQLPTDSFGYIANDTFGLGHLFGANTFLVYNDTGNIIRAKGLIANSLYHVRVIEYNGIGSSANYLTSSVYDTSFYVLGNIYYSKSSGLLNVLGTWGTNTDGTGDTPTTFNNANTIYNIANNPSPTISNNFFIAGSGTAVVINGNLNLTIPSGLILGSDSIYVRNNATVTVVGQLLFNKYIFDSLSTVQFISSSPQTIVGNDFFNLVITGGQKSINTPIRVRNNLSMLTNLNANGHLVTIGSGPNQIGNVSASSSYIIGSILRWKSNTQGSSMLFPIGTPTRNTSATLVFSGNTLNPGTIRAEFVASVPGNGGLPIFDFTNTPVVTVNKTSPAGYWQFDQGNGLNLGIASYELSLATNNFPGVSNFSLLRSVRRANSASVWQIIGTAGTNTGTNVAATVMRSGINTFGQFGIASDSASNALPVELVNFNGNQANLSVLLKWQTSAEINSDYFEIQRSADLQNWAVLGKVNAAINSTSTNFYNFNDNHPISGTNYYRLKIVDKDGSYENSKITQVSFEENSKHEGDIVIYPNPTNCQIHFYNPNAFENEVIIYDLTGNALTQAILTPYTNTTIANEQGCFEPGIYIVGYKSANETRYQKLIVK
jgi:hypothetical protein